VLQSLVIQRECLWTEAPLLDHLSGPLAIGLDGSNRLRQRRWADQVRPRRRILAGWRLHRPDSPRREARRFARDTADEVRACH